MYRVGEVIAISLLLSSLAAPAWAAEPTAKDREADKKPGQAMQQPGTQTQQQTSQAPAGRQSLCQSQAPVKSQAGQEPQPTGASGQKGQVLKGEFVRMEGENYVMQDQGKEVCVRTTYATFLDQTFVPGDIITVQLAPDGTAIVISRVLETQGQTQTAQGSGQPSETPSASNAGSTKENAPTVRGELLKIQGEFYTVKDASGNEVRLHVNKDTKMDGSFQVGDKIEAEQTSSGHAVSLRKASEGKTGPGAASPPAR